MLLPHLQNGVKHMLYGQCPDLEVEDCLGNRSRNLQKGQPNKPSVESVHVRQCLMLKRSCNIGKHV